MKIIYLLGVCCAVVAAKHHGTATRRQPTNQQPSLRRTRRIPAPPRKLTEEELPEPTDNFAPQTPPSPPMLPNMFPRVFNNFPTDLTGLFSAPRGLINGLVGGNTPILLGGTETNAENSATSLGEFVDRTRNVAGTGFDTIEMITSGLAQKGRSAVDRATTKAVNLVGSGFNLGTNSVETGTQAVRGLQGEAKRVVAAAINPGQTVTNAV